MLPHCSLIWISVVIRMLTIFSCASWPPECLLWRNGYLDPPSIFWLGYLFLWYWAACAVGIFWRLILCSFLHLQILSPILRVVFFFFLYMVSFAMQKLLTLIKSHLFIFVFIFFTLGGKSKKILLLFMSKNVLWGRDFYPGHKSWLCSPVPLSGRYIVLYFNQ